MTITNTIGTGVGRDYATIQAWESATSISLSQVYVGEVYHDGAVGAATYTMPTGQDRILIQGASGITSTRYRVLRAADGQQHQPVEMTGVRIDRSPGITTSFKTGIEIVEDRFRLERMAIRDTPLFGATSGFGYQVYVNDVLGVRIERCYIENSSAFCDGTNGTAGLDIVRFKTKSTASGDTKGRLQSCILVGGGRRGNRGAIRGARIEGSNAVTDVLGCTIVDVVGHDATTGTGFNRGLDLGGAASIITGNIVVRDPLALTTTNNGLDIFGLGASLFQANISTDLTAETIVVISPACKAGQIPTQTFVSPINQDFRILSSSYAASNFDASYYLGLQGVTTDYFGNGRGTPYSEIGAIAASLTATEAPPTEVVTTIGAGGDYATLAAWETATRGNLIEANEVRIGEVLGEVTGEVEITGSQTDAVRYRMLRPAADAHYKPKSDTGAKLVSSTNRDIVKIVDERYFRLEGPIKVASTTTFSSGDGLNGLVYVGEDADYTTVDGVFCNHTTTAAAVVYGMTGILVRLGQRGTRILNCTVTGRNGADNKGTHGGIRVRDLCDGKILNCTVWGAKLFATIGTSVGIKTENNSTYEVRNCIAIDNYNPGNAGSADFSLGTLTTSSNNLSGDASGDITGETASDTFFSHLANDFYLRAGISAAIDAGTNLLSDGVRLDQARSGRNVPFDLGALDGIEPYPRFPAPIKARRRVCHCFEIERRDGVRLQFTDNTTPVVFRGATWSPASFSASARRREIGNKPMNLDISGGLSSDKITLEDLRSGKYQGARMTEYVIDWRYPHLEPMSVLRYTIESTTFDGEQFKGEVQGLPFIMKTKVGNFYGRTCRHVLGNSECNAAYATDTNVPVASVIEPRRSFYCLGLSSITANHYRFGKLTWNDDGTIDDVYSSELVTVNQLTQPNVLTNAAWTASELTVTSIAGGFGAGVASFRLAANATAADHTLTQVLGQAWTALAPAKTRVCFSAYVRQDTSSTASHAELRLVNDGSPANHFAARFKYDGSAWVVSSSDAGVTATSVIHQSGPWYRISIAVTHDGQQPDDIGVALRVGNEEDNSNSERLQFARTQLEIDVLAPTTYTEAQLNKIVLAIKSNKNFTAGALFALEPGCDKLRTTCRDKFSNINNFGGFPFVPGQDAMFDTPTQ
jgi:uncharacterized phage protein (TIGR02218 family)